jgi:beta-phosphoglucomutase-like phosphatase (HAD superfamily)
MQVIEGILFEPVGCFAEFPSGSRAWWHLPKPPEASWEIEAVDAANVYEDVIPALTELKAMGLQLIVASSLSRAALDRFLEISHTRDFFSAVWNRENGGGIRDAPLRRALAAASLPPDRTLYLTDTAEGMNVARATGVNPILMMNDPDEAKRLAMLQPAGGIVSLLELPDFIRFVSAQNAALEGAFRPVNLLA